MMKDNTHPSPFKLKLDHQLEHRQEAEEFTIDANVKIIRQGSLPLQEAFFSSTVDNFIFEDEDCPEKVELYELFIDAGIVEFDAQFMLIDMILYVSEKTKSLDDDYKGVLTLTVEVTLPPKPVEFNRVGSEQTQSQEAKKTKTVEQWLKPDHKIQKAVYKIGADGVSLVRSPHKVAT
ncbi:hypothetical protein HID58_037508 [Brassica napus]|uniref:BnaAnng19570D protein n=3 Tax=Brassica napus TaxID=3708 RepID=A0A078JDY0_BRANA|nr:hypothetical protein HID58_037508 [Brassica napus]CAF2312972.1 unnamed protein product [Brassica napus]CDY64655.1 BnaAnng19570D [Brassica napus]